MLLLLVLVWSKTNLNIQEVLQSPSRVNAKAVIPKQSQVTAENEREEKTLTGPETKQTLPQGNSDSGGPRCASDSEPCGRRNAPSEREPP